MIFYFVRHGQTDWNKTHRLQGVKFDEPLNEQGIKDMEEVVPKLPSFEVIYSSPLKRVIASAQIIAKKTGKKIIVREELVERNFGTYAGKTWSEIPNGEKLHRLDQEQKYNYHNVGGESVEDVRARAQSFINDVKKSKYNEVLVVTSLGVIRAVYDLYLKGQVVDKRNGSIHKVEI